MALDWESQRAVLQRYYLTEDKKLKQVMGLMTRKHGFTATKSQYETQFKKWDWRKNLTNHEWGVVASRVRKRQSRGRISEVYFKGNLIPRQKVKKELSRQVSLTQQYFSGGAPSPRTPEGLSICSPVSMNPDLGPWSIEVEMSGMMPFDGLKSKREPETGTFLQWPGSTPLDISVNAPQSPNHRYMFVYTMEVPILSIAFLPWFDFLDFFRSEDITRALSLILSYGKDCRYTKSNGSRLAGPNSFSETESFTSDLDIALSSEYLTSGFTGESDSGQTIEALATVLFTGEYGFEKLDGLDRLKAVKNSLKSILNKVPEKNPGEIDDIFEVLLGPPSVGATQRLLEIVVFLLSNNMLDRTETDSFMDWLIETVPWPTLERLLRIELPTIEAFACSILGYSVRTGNVILLQALLIRKPGLKSAIRSNRSYLCDASLQGNTENLHLLLEAGADVNMTGQWDGSTPLHSARTVEVARILVKAHCDIDAVSKYGTTVLYEAVRARRFDVAEYLLSVGAKIDTYFAGIRRANVLVPAVESGEVAFVRLLLEKGADLDCQLPLQAAIEEEDVDMVRLLLIAGSSVNAMLVVGPPLCEAARSGNIEIAQLLLSSGADINATDQYGTAIENAVERDDLNMVQLLLLHGAHITHRDYNESLLPKATSTGDAVILKLLLEAGANPRGDSQAFHNAIGRPNGVGWVEPVSRLLAACTNAEVSIEPNCGKLQLIQAVLQGSIERVRALMKDGVKIDMEIDYVFSKSWAILHYAILPERPNVDLFQLLVDNIDDINAQNDNDDVHPILSKVAEHCEVEFISILLDAGAQVQSSHGLRALRAAVLRNKVDTIQLLLNRGAITDSYHYDELLREAFFKVRYRLQLVPDHQQIIQAILNWGESVNMTGNHEFYGESLLISVELAIINNKRYGLVDIVRQLLRLKANVNAPAEESESRTALQAAAEGDIELTRILLEAGADVNAPAARTRGVTALQAAAIEGGINIAKLLLDYGADINAPGSEEEGRTALEGAAEHGRLDMVQLLLDAGADIHLPGEERFVGAIDYARKEGHFAIFNFLQARRHCSEGDGV